MDREKDKNLVWETQKDLQEKQIKENIIVDRHKFKETFEKKLEKMKEN